ncbi:MAG TPA: hypothetical protein PK024_09440 [Methanospirillum sp.]|uniref:hypothetical protein n=1 Tax=Methanospirillum sp. TaxID=45200 RepID=UPI002CE0972B|nr:hypothetical protein [Methanospirillum sp.]HOJ97042.1 hypothetical protein [Methanospirillum sp.]HPP77824.1 hypothetical protein [Methanospirillum sp.]
MFSLLIQIIYPDDLCFVAYQSLKKREINNSKPVGTISNHLVQNLLFLNTCTMLLSGTVHMIWNMIPGVIFRRIFLCALISSCFFLIFCTGFADKNTDDRDGAITFHLTDIGNDEILKVSLMKEGESSKNGMVRQEQAITFLQERNDIIWSPCNGNSCMFFSSSTAGGKTGRDQLILTITMRNRSVDVSSCHGDSTCERLKGAIYTKSGMIDGILYTGRTYTVSVGSLRAGIGESFTISEIIP